MTILAVAVGGLYSAYRLVQTRAPSGLIVGGMLTTILSAAAATYLVFYFVNAFLVARYGLFAPHEGVRFIWTLIGGAVAAVLYCKKRNISLGRALDVGAALPVPLGLAIGRLGCLAAGCCYGKPTDSWLGMYLPDEYGMWTMRYPTQVMSMAANLLTFLILLAWERGVKNRAGHKWRWPFDGFLMLLFVTLYGLKRVLIGVLRDSGPPLWGPFTWMELLALAALAGSIALIVWNLIRSRTLVAAYHQT